MFITNYTEATNETEQHNCLPNLKLVRIPITNNRLTSWPWPLSFSTTCVTFFSCKPVRDGRIDRHTDAETHGRAVFTRQRRRSRHSMPQWRSSVYRIFPYPRYFGQIQTPCLVPGTAPDFRRSQTWIPAITKTRIGPYLSVIFSVYCVHQALSTITDISTSICQYINHCSELCICIKDVFKLHAFSISTVWTGQSASEFFSGSREDVLAGCRSSRQWSHMAGIKLVSSTIRS